MARVSFSQILTAWLSGMSLWAAGAGIVADLLIILSAGWIMPAGDRHRLRLALMLLGLHVAVLLPAPLLAAEASRWFRLVALFLLLSSFARAGFLLIMDGVVQRRLGSSVPQIFRDLLQVTLFAFAGLATLAQAGVDLSSLLATSALITAVVGLSLQETLGNTIAGVAMQAQPPFAVGDWIELDGGRIGQVTYVGWRSITLWTSDDTEITVPNGMLAKGAILNYSRPAGVTRRIVNVVAPYSEPPHHVEAVLLDAITAVPGVLANPAPQVVTGGFGASGIEYQVRFFITEFRIRDPIDSLVRDRIWYAFRREGITMPYPTQNIYWHQAAERDPHADEEPVHDRMVTLGRVDFLAALPEQSLRDLALSARRKPYGAGELIIEQGDLGEEFYVIRRGEVAVLSGDRQLARLSEGQFFGEMSLMTGAPRSATIRAIGPCEMVVINKPSMQEVLESHPELVLRITAALESRAPLPGEVAGPGGQGAVTLRPLIHRIRDFFKLA